MNGEFRAHRPICAILTCAIIMISLVHVYLALLGFSLGLYVLVPMLWNGGSSTLVSARGGFSRLGTLQFLTPNREKANSGAG